MTSLQDTHLFFGNNGHILHPEQLQLSRTEVNKHQHQLVEEILQFLSFT